MESSDSECISLNLANTLVDTFILTDAHNIIYDLAVVVVKKVNLKEMLRSHKPEIIDALCLLFLGLRNRYDNLIMMLMDTRPCKIIIIFHQQQHTRHIKELCVSC